MGLRDRLKRETWPAHKRLDQALIKHDLTTQLGLSSYLEVHYIARQTLNATFSVTHKDSALELIRNDLTTLGVGEPLVLETDSFTNPHPVGLTYVIAGSSLGSKVLYKVWSRSLDETVKRAGKFMYCFSIFQTANDFINKG